jgi:hypothetical protein
MARRVLQHTMVQDVTHAPRLALGARAWSQAVWTNSTACTRLRLPNVPEAWANAKLLRQVPGATLVIMALIPVRMLAER